MRLDQEVIQWALRRRISPDTLRALSVGGEIISFGDANRLSIVFNYLDNAGEIVNWKARSLNPKIYRQKPSGTQQFYNQAAVLAGPLDEIYIVEGEMDALSLVEAGVPRHAVLSVVGGAPANKTESPTEAKRYGYIADARDSGMSRCTRFILVTDRDDPGRHLRADLAQVLGAAHCHWVEWPEGVKDANDALQQWGAEDLSLYLREGVKPYPIEGIYRLSEIPEPPALTLWQGWPEWESKLKISPTCLSILSGWPGHGKSHLSQQLWAQIVRRYDIRVALMSMETREKPFVRRNLRSAYWSKLEIEMSESEKKEADDWIEDHFLFIHHPRNAPTFDWVCDMVNNAYTRHGISAASIDPWNMIVPTFNASKETETSWIGRSLDQCTYLAKACNLHLQILAHPAKPIGAGVREPITYSSIAGSQHWANKADQVLSIHRDQFVDEAGHRDTNARLIVLKSRYEELGFPCEIGMQLSLSQGIFKCTDYRQTWQS